MTVDAVKIGELSLGAAMPTALEAKGAIDASTAIALPDLEARIAGITNIQTALTVAPPQLAATISAAQKTVTALQAAVEGPTVTLQASAVGSLLAELQATLGSLQAQISFAGDLGVMLGTAGIHLYKASGDPATAVGDALRSTIDGSPPGTSSDPVGAVVLAASAPPAITKLGEFFGVALQ